MHLSGSIHLTFKQQKQQKKFLNKAIWFLKGHDSQLTALDVTYKLSVCV